MALNYKVYLIILNNVIKPRSALCAAKSVIYRLVNKDHCPRCPVISLKIIDKPLALSVDKILVLSAVASCVKHDEVSHAVVVGIDALVCILGYALKVGICNISGYRCIESRSTAIVGVVEVEIEIKRSICPCIVVTHSSKHRGGCSVVAKGLEIHIPHILVSAVFNKVTCVKYKRSIGKSLKSFLVCGLSIHKSLVTGGSTRPGYTLSIAYCDEREITYNISGSLKGICLAPIVCLVCASRLTYLVLISGIGLEICDIALEVILV